MALQKTVSNESIRNIILVLIALPLVASSNIDCGGKAFYCVNSTHFMICVDLGGGVSSTIDNFIIPCPPSTVCQRTNHFECEFPQSTTVLPIIETSVPSELRLSEIKTVTDTSIITTTNEIISEVQSTDININTVSITTLQEDIVTTNKPVTESVLVENTPTYTNIGYTLTTAPDEYASYINTIDTSTLTTSDDGYPVTQTSTSLYHDTVATLLVDDVTVTTDPNILENIAANSQLYDSSTVKNNETGPEQSATETFIVDDTFGSFTTEKYTTLTYTLNNETKLSIENNDLYQITTNEVIDTTVGTSTTVGSVDITSTNIVITDNFTEAFTESNQSLNDATSYFTSKTLTGVTNIENINISEVLATTSGSQGFDLITDATPGKSVTEQYKTLQEVVSTDRVLDVWNIHTNKTAFDNSDKIELVYISNSTGGSTIETITTIAETTYDTTNTNAITQEHNTTESISQATITYNNEGIEFTTPATIETTIFSIVTADTVNTLNQETSGLTRLTLDGLTTTSEKNIKSNISENGTASILVTRPLSISQLIISETNNETQTTSSIIESSTINVAGADISSFTTQTLNNIDTVPSENRISSNNLVMVSTNNVKDLTVSGVNITNTEFTNLDFEKNTTEETSKKSGLIAEDANRTTQSTERNVNDYSFTGFTEGISVDEKAPTISSSPGRDITKSVKAAIVLETSTAFLDMKTENVSKQNTTLQNDFDSTKDISNPILVTEPYKLTDTISTMSDITYRPEINTDMKVQDQTLITTETDIPITIIQKRFTTEYNQETTTMPAMAKQAGLQGTTLPNTFDSTKDISNPILVTESYKMTGTLPNVSNITNRPGISTDVKVQGQTLITTVTDIPITINPKILTTEHSQETTTVLAVAQQEVGLGLEGTTVDSTYISKPVINDLDNSYILEKITEEINKIDQGVTDNILGSKTGLINNMIHDYVTVRILENKNFPINNVITTESSLSSSNNYPVDTVTEDISQIMINAVTNNQKEYDIATTVHQVLTSNLNVTSTQSATKEATTTEISLASALQAGNVKTNTQESIINSEFTQSTVTQSTPIKPVFEPYLVDAKLKIETERTVDITAPSYTSYSLNLTEATNNLINNNDELVTIKPLIPNGVFTDILNSKNSTSHQLWPENSEDFKANVVETIQSNHNNEFGNTVQQITSYKVSGGILRKTDINSNDNSRNISDSLQTLSINDSTADTEEVGKLNENNNLTDRRNTYTTVGDVTFGANNQRNESLIALSTSVDIVEKSTNENMNKYDNIIQTSKFGNETTRDTNNTNIYNTKKEDVNLNLQSQSNNSFNINNKENISDKITNFKELSIITNEQIIEDVNKTSINSTNNGIQTEFDMSVIQVANDNNQNIYSINNYHLTDRIQDKLLKHNPIAYSQNNAPQIVQVIKNEQDSLKTQIKETQENGAMKHSVATVQQLGENVEASTNKEIFKEIVFSTANVTTDSNDGLLNHSTLLYENLAQTEEVSTTNTPNKKVESVHEIKATLTSINGSFIQSSKYKILDTNLHQNTESSITNTLNDIGPSFNKIEVATTLKNFSLNHIRILDENIGHNTKASEINNKNVSFVESQVTSMPIDGSLKQTLVGLHQRQSQNAAARETNTKNVTNSATNVINRAGVVAIQHKGSVTPNDGFLNHQLTYAEQLVQNTDSNLAGSDSKPIENNTHLPSDSSPSAFPKDHVRNNNLENFRETKRVFLNNPGNTPVYTTHEVTTSISTESTVKYTTQNSNADSTNSFTNGQKLINPFCFTRTRGRYADRDDCTKFYVCIGRTEPIVGICPENTVFSEIKKQCTKNKSHCFRGNEFQCLSEGRFSDILKNNAYYICIKRQNSFIRFKFQCQNGYYLNKITVRCTKQLEITNQSSTSADSNSNSDKSVSEGMTSTETKKSRDSIKESKSGEEFECKKEGKFANRDNCRKFYVCTKTKKSEFRMRRKTCDSDEVFHKDKKKCIDADSYEC